MKVLIFLCSILAGLSVFGTDITVVTENAPPYNYEVDGKVVGVGTEVLEALFSELKLEQPEIKVYPWARAYRMALYGSNTLIYSITRTAEREDKFKWVGTIAPVTVYLYKRRGRKDIQIRTLDDAKQYVVGGAQSDAKLQYLESKGFKISEIVHSDKLNLRKLNAGRIDLAPFEELRLIYASQQMPEIDVSDFEKAFPLQELFLDVSIAFSLKTPDAVIKRFSEALEKIKADGRHAKILKKYIP